MVLKKSKPLRTFTFYKFHKLTESSWKAIFSLLPLDKIWLVNILDLPMNKTLHCNWYAQQKYFAFIVLPGIVEFIHKDITFFENMATKQGLLWLSESLTYTMVNLIFGCKDNLRSIITRQNPPTSHHYICWNNHGISNSF